MGCHFLLQGPGIKLWSPALQMVSCIANGLLHCKWSPALQANSLLTEPSGKPEKNKLNSHSHSCASKHAKSLQSCPALTATLQTAAYQAPLSMGFSRQEQWSGLPCPPIMAFTHTSATQGQSCFLIHLAPCIPPAPQQSPRGEATSSGLQFWEPSFTFGGQIFSFHSLSPWS